jgi:hypothetical protein
MGMEWEWNGNREDEHLMKDYCLVECLGSEI